MKRLLILSCSQRKHCSRGVLPAIDRYDGPTFRVLRKYLAGSPADAPVVLILSARYGLIEAKEPIVSYDCRMSASLAKQLRPQLLQVIARILQSERWRAIGLCLGKHYRAAIDGFLASVPEGVRIDTLGGGLGPRLTNLYSWLRGETILFEENHSADQSARTAPAGS